jgi:hypothetical protein
MDKPQDLIPTTAARAILKVSTKKMASLLKEGTIRHFPSALDKRKKLVSRAEVVRLKSEAA